MSLSAARGIARIARFDAAGLSEFDASPQGLLAALTPWFAFALVAFGLFFMSGDRLQAVTDLLASIVALLAPSVASHALTRWFGREARWLRYAVAVVWCQWVMPPALIVALTGSFLLIAGGVPDAVAERTAMLALLGYALALNLFLARKALSLTLWRAAAVVISVNLATGAAVLLPRVLQMVQEIGR